MAKTDVAPALAADPNHAAIIELRNWLYCIAGSLEAHDGIDEDGEWFAKTGRTRRTADAAIASLRGEIESVKRAKAIAAAIVDLPMQREILETLQLTADCLGEDIGLGDFISDNGRRRAVEFCKYSAKKAWERTGAALETIVAKLRVEAHFGSTREPAGDSTLLAWANANLKGNELGIVKELVGRGAMPIVDFAAIARWRPQSIDDSYKELASRVNDKLKKHNYRVVRHNGIAHLERISG